MIRYMAMYRRKAILGNMISLLTVYIWSAVSGHQSKLVSLYIIYAVALWNFKLDPKARLKLRPFLSVCSS